MGQGTGKISKKYAKALFDAISKDSLETMRSALNELSQVWMATPEMKMAALNPSLTAEQRAKLSLEIASSIKPGDKEFGNFISLLIENKRAVLIPEIAQSFSSLVDEFKAAMSLEITSAFEIPAVEKAQYEEKIRMDLGSLVKIDWKIDQEILGGMLIKSGDKLIDSSVKGSLKKMASQLLA